MSESITLHKFPPTEQVSRLAKLVILGGADLDSLEEKLYDAIATNNTTINDSTSSHESKIFLCDVKNATDSKEHTGPLIKLLDLWLSIRASQEYNLIRKRIDYIITTWRVVESINQVIHSGNENNISVIESFAYDMIKQFNDFTIFYFYWMNLILTNTERTIHIARKGKEDRLDTLMDIVIRNAHDEIRYDSGMAPNIQTLLRKHLPLPFYIGNLDLFNLKLRNVIDDENLTRRLNGLKALNQWIEGHRANAMSGIATCYEEWIKQSSNTDNSKQGADIIMCLAYIIEEIVREDLAPAHEFLEIMCDKLHRSDNVLMLPYIYHLYLDIGQGQSDVERKIRILEKYPSVTKLKDSLFEEALMSQSLEWDERHMLARNFINKHNTTENADGGTRSNDTADLPLSKYSFSVSDKVKREILDIELLEFMSKGDYIRALNALIASANSNIIASEVVIIMLVKNFYDQKDLQSIQKLRANLSNMSKLANDIFRWEIKLTMQGIYSLWNESKRQIALEDSLIQYQMILNNGVGIDSDTRQSAITAVLRYIRLFVEELCQDEQNAALQNVEKFGKICLDTNETYHLLLILWEALFFSHRYSHYVLAKDFLKRNPKVATQIDFLAMLNKASKLNQEKYFLELFNISLEFDLNIDLKSNLLAALLTYYCENGMKAPAKEYVQISVDLKIPVSADTMLKFNQLNIKPNIISQFLQYIKVNSKK